MKRIDDKIKEIEKKDKSSRILYIAFIGVILIAMGIILSQIKGINERDDIISDNEIELIAKRAALQLRVSKTVSTNNISAPPSNSASDCCL